jgi:hypothetical protein
MCHREEQLVSRGGEDNWRGYRDEDKKREELGNRQLHLPHLFRSRAWKTAGQES